MLKLRREIPGHFRFVLHPVLLYRYTVRIPTVGRYR